MIETLNLQIETLMYENASNLDIAKVLKKEIKIYFDTLPETFMITGGKDFLLKHTKKIDEILKIIYKVAQREMFGHYAPMKNSLPVAMVALGSYGREQLCVYSDIDLMLVYKNISGYNMEMMIEKMLYILWDTGLKLGHRVHEVEELLEVSRTDTTIKTALLESRLVQGSLFLWTEVENAISQIRHDNPQQFIEDKLQEQALKHQKFPLTMEPNLKEGVGGFRDANLIFWIGKVLYNVNSINEIPLEIITEKNYRHFRMALEFLFRVRSALHLACGKKEDRLRLDLIPEVARYLGYEEGRLGQMKCATKVTGALKTLRLYSIIWAERLCMDYDIDENNSRLNMVYPHHKIEDLNSLLSQLIENAQAPFEVHPTLLQKLIHAQTPKELSSELYQNIQRIFYQPHAHSILNTLSYAKLLIYMIPPIAKVVNLPQFDGYHTYAVDVHSLKCLEYLENIKDAYIQERFDSLNKEEKMMLKVVVFLHDAGKGRSTDHHIVGVSLFRKFALKIEMDEALVKTGENLILHHTLMSRVAQREDLHNEKVILKFASHFPSKKLLDMIYILTYADMSGVGPQIYNAFSGKLIKTLYHESVESLKHKNSLSEIVKRVKKENSMKKTQAFLALKRSQQNKILNISNDLLFIKYNPKEIVDIAKRAFEVEHFSFWLENKGHLTIEIVHKEKIYLAFLLSKLSSLKVIQMDSTKLFDTYEYFKISFSECVNEEDIERIKAFIPHTFEKDSKSRALKVPKIQKSEIRIDAEHSKYYGALYLNTIDQKGLLAFVVESFHTLGLVVSSTKVHTLKKRTKDIFLIEKDRNFSHNMDLLIKKLTGQR
jgi:[protein-PII] uridylyltransferase